VPVVSVTSGARNEHGPPRDPFLLLRRRRGRGRSCSRVTPLLRRQPNQRLRIPLRSGGGRGHRQEREESTNPPPSHRHPGEQLRVLAREIEEESRGSVILPVGTVAAFYSRGGVLLTDTWCAGGEADEAVRTSGRGRGQRRLRCQVSGVAWIQIQSWLGNARLNFAKKGAVVPTGFRP
jgi:hypothetical protein